MGSDRLGPFWIANYLALVALALHAAGPEPGDPLAARGFVLAVALTYPAFYLLPAAALAWGAGALLGRRWPRAGAFAALGVALLGCSAVAVALWADLRLHRLYGFHVNGFVWNLLTTPGGLRALGASDRTYWLAGAVVAGVVATEAALAVALGPALDRFVHAFRRERTGPAWRPQRRIWVPALAVLLALSLGERVTFAVADLRDYTPVLRRADGLPFYLPMTAKRLAERVGIEASDHRALDLPEDGSSLAYPAEPLLGALTDPPLDVVWLCAESLRADAIDAHVTPTLSDLAHRSLWFRNHLSGGNGTRMGVFSMFYGLPGPYWFTFLRENRGPVVIDWVVDHGYQVDAYTSDDFSYPEFAQTVFARVPHENLHEAQPGPPSWKRDRETIGAVVDRIRKRDRDRPFFLFAFLESPHARYDFPPESVVVRPYLEDFDYVTSDPEASAELLHNRYRNSLRHLDQQIGRVLTALADEGLEDRTIVVVTGDHGEEFMEKGRWGHGSQFSEEQIRVPLLIHLPGQPAREIDRLTSHLDLPATILARLGVATPPSSFGTGIDLLGPERRHFSVVADWNTVGYVDDAVKLRIPLHPTAWRRQALSTRNDDPLSGSEAEAAMAERSGDLALLVRNLGRFREHDAGGPR
jgi:hypothetical protein